MEGRKWQGGGRGRGDRRGRKGKKWRRDRWREGIS